MSVLAMTAAQLAQVETALRQNRQCAPLEALSGGAVTGGHPPLAQTVGCSREREHLDEGMARAPELVRAATTRALRLVLVGHHTRHS